MGVLIFPSSNRRKNLLRNEILDSGNGPWEVENDLSRYAIELTQWEKSLKVD